MNNNQDYFVLILWEIQQFQIQYLQIVTRINCKIEPRTVLQYFCKEYEKLL